MAVSNGNWQHTSNRNKSTFSFLHQLPTWHCPHLLLHACCSMAVAEHRAAIDRYLLPAGHWAANLQQWHVVSERWDRRTHRRMPDRYIEPPYTMRAVAMTQIFKILNIVCYVQSLPMTVNIIQVDRLPRLTANFIPISSLMTVFHMNPG